MNWADVLFSTIGYKIIYVPILKCPTEHALEMEFGLDTTSKVIYYRGQKRVRSFVTITYFPSLTEVKKKTTANMIDLRSLLNTFNRSYIVAMFQPQNLQRTYRRSHEKARTEEYSKLRNSRWLLRSISIYKCLRWKKKTFFGGWLFVLNCICSNIFDIDRKRPDHVSILICFSVFLREYKK